MSTQIPISAETLARLQNLADRSGKSIEEVLAVAIDGLDRKMFLDDCNHAYARLRADNAVWKDELAEREARESTVGDGLEEWRSDEL